jgi:exodeoxyribonuclease VII large subunit
MASPLRLSELTQTIQSVLDRQLEPSYWIVAEIGELRIAGQGHCYLDLIEKQENQILARTRANIWAYNFRTINAWFETVTGSTLQAGMEILCQASVQFHSIYGLSLTISDIDPAYTLGARERKRQETIAQLKADGVFDMNRMMDLPLVPQRVAIISSATAAGYGDFINQLEDNSFGYVFNTQLFPAGMQGAAAAASIIDVLHSLAEHSDDYDLVVLIRGGGAQMDLDCFDDYELCSHIAQFPLPILTGIGHERDETIADLVAHTKLKTPTAVAEFLINGFRNFESKIELLARQTQRKVNDLIITEESKIATMLLRIRDYSKTRILEEHNALNHRRYRMHAALKNVIKHERMELSRKTEFVLKSACRNMKIQKQNLEYLEKNINLLDPLRMLERGYMLCQLNGKRWRPEETPQVGQELITLQAQFRVRSTITHVEKRED